jgi:hypothetical protein
LQLQPGAGFQGVLGGAAALAALKQLRITRVTVLDDSAGEALAAALSHSPAGLEHLSINELYAKSGRLVRIPADVLQHLGHLTHLKLGAVEFVGVEDTSSAPQPLQALTALVALNW